MAKTKASARRGGRKKNEWTLVTLDELLEFIDTQGITQNKFAKTLGVTNSTFHNWKNGRCAPDESIQGKIRALIDGKEKIEVSEKKTETTAKKKTRGGKSSTLAALGKGKKATQKAAKKVTKKVAKAAKKTKKKAAKASKKTKRTAKKAVPVANGNGAHLSFEDWNELEALGQFVKANKDKSVGEMQTLLGTLSRVAKIMA